jgi:predicted nucleotidyltransferase
VKDFTSALETLADGGVDFIIVGGIAAVLHGAARPTYDLDIVYARTPENLTRVVATLAPSRPYLRGAPPGLPFRWDVETVSAGLNFTLVTELGDIDLLGEVTGGGRFEDLVKHAQEVQMLGRTFHVVTLEGLIRLKTAAGRSKDLDALAELEALLEERDRQP